MVMGLFACPYEDTDLWCQYYSCICKGSKNCDYVLSCWWLEEKAGNLTVLDKALNVIKC